MSSGHYHEQMVRLATEQYKDHQLVRYPDDPDQQGIEYEAPWLMQRVNGDTWQRDHVDIRPVAFNRLLVHSSHDPLLLGGYKRHPEPAKYHDMIDLIGTRDWPYMEYVLGKAIPRPPNYYDEKKAEEDLKELRSELTNDDGTCPEWAQLHLADIQDALNSSDWYGVHHLLYEYDLVEAEDISRFGQVLAPPYFYYGVAAVKRLWELLEDQP